MSDFTATAEPETVAGAEASEVPERSERIPGKRGESGTHMGKLSPELRRNRIAKNARNRSRRGDGAKKPCSSYEGCNHRKHGKSKAKR